MKAKHIGAFARSNPLILVCLIILQFFSTGRAQTRLDYQTVENFFDAIADNDTNTASQLLESNTNLVFARNNGSKLPFLEAATAGNVSLIRRMLELGADINEAGDNFSSFGMQNTALHWAVERNHFDVCQFLLEAGANPNRMNGSLSSPLHLAFNENRGNIANLLLDYGADPFLEKLFTNDKTTPFELAVTRSDGKLVPRMLGQDRSNPLGKKSLTKSMPPNRPRQPAKTAADILAGRGAALLAAATQRGELEAVQALLVAGVSAKTNVEGDLPLLQTFALSAAEAVKARPSAIAQWQQTSNTLKNFGTNANPQFITSIRSQEADQSARGQNLAPERWMKIRDLLIKNGAAYDAFAATALGDTNQARRLLAADKNVVQARDRDGQTLLHWAVQTDQLPLTSFWLQAGVSPAATNFAGQTALHIVATKGLTEQVKLLLAANAPTDIRDTNGWTPLDAAIQANQSDCIHLLMAKAPVGEHLERGLATPLHEAAASGNVAALAGLLDTETNLEARNELTLTPLQVAVLHGHLAAAALLVDRGADVNVCDPVDNTLLHQILLQDRLTIYDRPPSNWLARVSQDPGKQLYLKYLTVGQNEQGSNPLLQAASFLLASGANATATNNAGETAMQLITDEKTGRRVFFFDNDRTELLQLLGAHGSNVNERDADGNMALHRLSSGFYDVSKVDRMASLIASGADVNATNNLGQTPLHVAAENIGLWDYNNPPVNDPFQLLIYSKANVNAQDNDGMTPLHILASAGTSFKQEATRALLDAGADPNLRNKHGRTPAHLFLSGGWPWNEAGECVDMIVKAGADLSVKDDQGKTPLHYLAALGSQKPMFFIRGVADIFVAAKVDFQARDNDGDTPLHIAAKAGTGDVFGWLLQHGASLDATNNAGQTPRQMAINSGFRNADTDIYQAIGDGKIESVVAILKSEPNLLNKTNSSGQTPLLAAVQANRTNIVEFLDKQGAEWDSVSAVLAGRTDVLRKLIAQKPRLATDGSLLRLAAVNGNAGAVETLLAAGSDLKATDSFGLSPLGNALLQQHGDVASLLVKQGAVKNIFDAVFANDPETVAALIVKDKSLVSATNAQGVSVAEVAAATGNETALKLLLDKNVSPNFKNMRTGESLLLAAAAYSQTNTAELLIQRGARLDVADDLGLTPLHLAATRGSTEVLELLLKHKADPNVRVATSKAFISPAGVALRAIPNTTWEGNTALHLAAVAAQTNAIELLIKWGASVDATNSAGMTALDFANQFSMPPFWPSLMHSADLRLPFTAPNFMRRNPNGCRTAAALLVQAGAKQRESYRPNGMPVRF